MKLKKPKHLRYCLMGATLDCNENRHAQVVMKELGITYEKAIPQSLGDQWWFWNCENVPTNLPEYLTELKLDAKMRQNYGLYEEQK